MSWEVYAFLGGLLVQLGVLLAGIQAMRRDVNGIGKKTRRMVIELLDQAADRKDFDAVKRIAGMLCG